MSLLVPSVRVSAERLIVRAIHDADRVVRLDAVTLGGHSYTMKRAQTASSA
jgi:hypothetical protein